MPRTNEDTSRHTARRKSKACIDREKRGAKRNPWQ